MSGNPRIEGRRTSAGGRRAGSGPKPMWMLPEYQVIRMNQAAKRRAKAEGRTIDDVLLDIVYARSGEVLADVDTAMLARSVMLW